MKALVHEGAEEIRYREVPDPVPGPGEEPIRIAAAGICGSEMRAWAGHDDRHPAPLILGHEAAGVIEGGPRDGEPVTIDPLATCGQCPACASGRENLCPERLIISMPPREGAFARYLAMPAQNLVPVADEVPLARAVLAEPLAMGWHGVRLRLAALDPAEARCALALAAQGCEEVTIAEPDPARRACPKERCGLSAVEAVDRPAPLLIDAVGLAATRAAASALAAPGGIIVHIGLGQDRGGFDIRRMTLQEITFIGTYTCIYRAGFPRHRPCAFRGTSRDPSTGPRRAPSRKAQRRFAISARAASPRPRSCSTRAADNRPPRRQKP